MKLRFARSATKHRIPRANSRFVIEQSGMWIELPAPHGAASQEDVRLLFLGDDPNGMPLEVMAIALENEELLVIHAMRLRAKFQNEYMELKQWRD